ncbi:hypothetical protein JOD82_001985 [Paenibacillus sp. 1182]|uniref:hypothetical protein n=1 Tax=Paenibacillus sp. 1182 TaxID=2806565 RepID=UPI001AE348C6|nr:hypothetical protein [Paenibacillus sp. 1182]MBP1308965.1 hypothetical protein [Paenibacillus sp. 1182]
MSVEFHRCNVKDCKGFVIFDNADFDYMHPDVVDGKYEFTSTCCTECGKGYKVVPHHVVVSVEADEAFGYLEQASISEWEAYKRERQYEMETNPHTRIQLFLVNRGYTYSVSDIVTQYLKYQESPCYLSHSMKDCIHHLENEVKALISTGV